jgi:hypothetical protein
VLIFLFAESDRKINIDILETNKSANREDIRRLREESKELRAKLAQLQRVCLHYHPPLASP